MSTSTLSATILDLRNRTRRPNQGTNAELEIIAGLLYWTTRNKTLKPFAYSIFTRLKKQELSMFLQSIGLEVPKKTTASDCIKLISKQSITTIRPIINKEVLPKLTLGWNSVEVLLGISTAMRRELAESASHTVSRWVPCKYGYFPEFKALVIAEAAWKITPIKEGFLAAVESRISAEAKRREADRQLKIKTEQAHKEAMAMLASLTLSSSDKKEAKEYFERSGPRQASQLEKWLKVREEAIAHSKTIEDSQLRTIVSNVRIGTRFGIQQCIRTWDTCKGIKSWLKDRNILVPEANPLETPNDLELYWEALKRSQNVVKTAEEKRKRAEAANLRAKEKQDAMKKGGILFNDFLQLNKPTFTRKGTHYVLNPDMGEVALTWASLSLAKVLGTHDNQKRFQVKNFNLKKLESALLNSHQ